MTKRSIGRAMLCASAAALVLTASPAAAQRIDEIYAFGDSYADDGNLFQILGPLTPADALQVYPTGRFSGGTNYIDTLSQLLDAPVYNFAIGGALAGNTNTNGPGIPGFATEYGAFLSGGGGVFPTVSGSFDESDLVAVSIGGNDARFYQRNGGSLAGAPAAAATSIAQSTAGLNALVNAGAQNISFLAGNTALLPEIAGNTSAQAIRNAYSTAYNTGIQSTLAGYADDGVIVHYLDATLVLQQIAANPTAYGLTSAGACAPTAACVGDSTFTNGYLFYLDGLHLTSAGFAILGNYVATQLQAPLTLQGPSELGIDTARQFGRTLSSRVDLTAPRDGGLAEGMRLFVVGDTFSSDFDPSFTTDAFESDGVGVTAGVSIGLGTGVAGIAANYSRPRVRFDTGSAEADADTWQIGGFAGYTLAGLFAQGHIGFGKTDLDLERRGVNNAMTASTDSSHWLAGAKAGYLMGLGILRVGPVVALDYARAKVDGYSEDGDPALNLSVSSVKAKSLTGSIGAELRGDFGGGGVQLRPYAAAMLEAELSGNGSGVRFAQTASPTIVNDWQFEGRGKDPYGRLSAGANAEILTGINLNALVSGTIGRERGDDMSAHVGLNFGF